MAYKDQNYKQKEHWHDSLAQAFEYYKHGVVGAGYKWNNNVAEISGLTMRVLSDGVVEFTHHRYELADVYELKQLLEQDVGQKFIEDAVKGIKKEYKELTGKSITLTKTKTVPAFPEKVGRITAETSFISSKYTRHPVGKYLLRTTCIYSVK